MYKLIDTVVVIIHAYIYTHTHTHTHIYIYIYITQNPYTFLNSKEISYFMEN